MDKLLRKIILGTFHFLVVVTPLFFMFNTDELFEFNKMMLVYCGALVVVTAWMARMILQGKLLFAKTPLNWLLLTFIASQVLSTIFSIHPYTSWLGYYSRFHGGLLSTLSYAGLFWAFVNNVKKSELKAFFISIFGSSILVSIYAILEHFGRSVSCLLIGPEHNFDVSCWVQDVKNRVFATFGQPNWLAAYCITLIPFGTALAASSKRKMRIFYWISVLLLTLTLVYTQSRSGLLSFVVGLGMLGAGLLFVEWQRYKSQLIKSKVLLSAIALMIASTFIFLTLGPINPIERFWPSENQAQDITTEAESTDQPEVVVNRLEIGGTDSGEIRKIVWDGAIKVGLRYPLFGSGVETFAYSYYLDRPVEHNLVSEWDFLYNKAHNEFLNFFATTGFVGLLSYVALLGGFVVLASASCFSKIKKSEKQQVTSERLLIWSLVSSTVALSVSNFFGFSTVMVALLMFLYFAIWIVISRNDEVVNDHSELNIESHHYLGLGMIAIVFFVSALKIYNYWTADMAYTNGKAYFSSGYYNEGISYLTQAINKSPSEAVFYDELSISYAQLALAFATEDATTAAQLAQAAINASDKTIELNDRHLNFYKTRSKMFITLAQMDENMLLYAQDALKAALQKAPTDAKLMYNLGVIAAGLEDVDEAVLWLEEAVDIKPNYGAARYHLGQQYEKQERFDAAKAEYQYILENISPDDQRSAEALSNL